MIKLALNHGEEIYESKDIAKEVKTFYERLYLDKKTEISDMVMVKDMHTLTLQEKASIEGDNGACCALKNMKNTSPGSYGFTAELLKFFRLQSWGYLSLNKSLNNGLMKSELSSTPQKEGMIICIPKGTRQKM